MSEILEIGKRVLELEGNELLRHSSLLDDKFENALKLLYSCKGKVIVTGVGKSGHIGAKIAATMASTGTPSFFFTSNRGFAWRSWNGTKKRCDTSDKF